MASPRNIEELLDLVHEDRWTQLAERLASAHPADIALLIDDAPENDRARIFALVSEAAKPDVLSELETVAGADILDGLTNLEISDIVEEMAPDDAADVLSDLPRERSREVLELMEVEESADVRKLMQYAEDTAGGIMTTDVVAMREGQSVAEALEAIAYLDTREKFYQANLVDRDGRLIGYVDVWDLLRERRRDRLLGELAKRHVTTATVDMDQEEVARIMHRYDLTVLPVVDLDGRLVGRITSDDAIDVIAEEASEDIMRLAGTDDAELESTSAIRSCRIRLPWLLITLAGGFMTSLLLRSFQAHVAGMLVLVAFVPIVLAMGGNAGIQSSTLVVRSLALEGSSRRRLTRMLAREILVGAMMGLICGLVIGLWVHLVVTGGPGTVPLPARDISVIVAIALFSAMTFATVFGALVPIVLHSIRIDPAVASGPFITTANDIAALLIYFGVTLLLTQHVI